VWSALDFAAEPLAALSPQERLTLRDLMRRISADDPSVLEAAAKVGATAVQPERAGQGAE
jgi:hypothetical protein